MRPLVRMLLKRGVSYGSFSEIAKWVFADVAKREFEIPGKKISDTRVSVITGLTRHEVKNLLVTTSPEDFSIEEKHHRATCILNGWRLDQRFLDVQGKPLVLDLKGEGNSFERIVKEFGGDITYRAALDELVRSDSVELIGDQKVRLKSTFLLPKKDEDEILSILGEDVSSLAETIQHNIEHKGTSDYLQLTASSRYLSKKNEAFVRNEIKKKGIKFLEELDAWLMTQEVSPEDKDSEFFSGGVGVYYFEKRDGGTK